MLDEWKVVWIELEKSGNEFGVGRRCMGLERKGDSSSIHAYTLQYTYTRERIKDIGDEMRA